MAADAKVSGASNGAGHAATQLPPISVGKFREVSLLLERMVHENTALFVHEANRYRAEHRAATDRPLNAVEAAQIAGAWLDRGDEPIEKTAVRFQQSGLRAYDEPQPTEILLAAGIATAPAFMDVVLKVVALIEMPADEFEDARENDRLDGAIANAASDLDALDLEDARARAAAAMDHFASKAGVEPGKVWGHVGRSVWQALTQAMTQLTSPTIQDGTSDSSSLTGSAPSTDGPDETSSTEPGTERPSS